jgi:hypothetical protein
MTRNSLTKDLLSLNTSIQPQNQPKVAGEETKSALRTASEAIHGQRHSSC